MNWVITKGEAKDFEGAPGWALFVLKHAGEAIVFAEKKEVGAKRTRFFPRSDSASNFLLIENPDEYTIIAERQPAMDILEIPLWDGECQPQVGQQVMTSSGPGVIDFSGKDVIVYTNEAGQWSVRAELAKDILSAFETEKQKAVRAMGHNVTGGLSIGKDVREALYDAIAEGKIPGIRLED